MMLTFLLSYFLGNFPTLKLLPWNDCPALSFFSLPNSNLIGQFATSCLQFLRPVRLFRVTRTVIKWILSA